MFGDTNRFAFMQKSYGLAIYITRCVIVIILTDLRIISAAVDLLMLLEVRIIVTQSKNYCSESYLRMETHLN